MNLLEYHEPPLSELSGYYQKVQTCPNCFLHTTKEISLFVPCWRCGYVGYAEQNIAKWERFAPRWKFWRNKEGRWIKR